MTIVPTYELKAAATSNQAEITLTAIVPFRSEFAEAVAKNSKISFDRTILFAEREAEGRITFSNGETILKNQKFVCQIVDRKGKTEISYVGQSGKDGIGHFAFKVSTEMAGENFIRCWATGYEKDIIVEQQINFFVLPKASDALNFFIN